MWIKKFGSVLGNIKIVLCKDNCTKVNIIKVVLWKDELAWHEFILKGWKVLFIFNSIKINVENELL